MSSNVIKNFMTVDQKVFTSILASVKAKRKEEKHHRAKQDEKWKKLAAIASTTSSVGQVKSELAVKKTDVDVKENKT